MEQPPRLGLIIDDCLGTPLLSKPSAGLVNLVIKHRHVGRGLGLSIFMLVQSYCAQGGLNRAIRENCTLLLLFKINQDAQIKKLYEETDLDMTEEQFIQMCKEVHKIDYNFLCMDFAPKSEDKRFRSGWDTFIQPNIHENVNVNVSHARAAAGHMAGQNFVGGRIMQPTGTGMLPVCSLGRGRSVVSLRSPTSRLFEYHTSTCTVYRLPYCTTC